MEQVAFVTGGSRGIGFAIANALLGAGYRVAIASTSAESVKRALRELAGRASADRSMAITCDVRRPNSVEMAFQEVVLRFGGVDVLVNNAGVGTGAPVAELSQADWQRIIDTNLTGAFYCCKVAIPHLRRRGGGWIINVSSLSSTNPFAGGAAYCASKAGLNAFSESLMQELRHDNIRVSCILPGSVATGFSGRQTSDGAEWKLSPDDIARVVLDLLASPARSLPSRVEIRPSQPPRS